MATTERSRTIETFLVSLGAILLEVSWTRILSFKLVYYFTYLVIGIAMLGLGSGGVFVAVLPALRRSPTERVVPAACALAAACVLLGYPLVALMRVDAFDLVAALLRGQWSGAASGAVELLALCAVLAAPFLAAGVALAVIFSSDPQRIHRLYGADLLGAALGCAAVVPLITLVTPPGIVMLAGISFALAAMPLGANRHRPAFALAVVAGLVLAVGAVAPGLLPDPRPDRVKSLGAGASAASRVVYSRWSPVFRVDVATSLRPTPTSWSTTARSARSSNASIRVTSRVGSGSPAPTGPIRSGFSGGIRASRSSGRPAAARCGHRSSSVRAA